MQSKYKPYRLVAFSNLVLYKLYFVYLNDENKSEFTIDDILNSFNVAVSPNLVKNSLDLLRTGNPPLITRRINKNPRTYLYIITIFGLEQIEKDLRSKNSAVYHLHANGDDVLDEIAGIDGRFGTREEFLENDPWSPLPIDREDPLYIEAVSDLENAIDVIEKDNGFAVTFPEQREGILASLKFGIDWIKNCSPNKAQIFSLIVTPLQWISGNFSKATNKGSREKSR